jgi:iron complex transport system substrate-binding protein
MKCRLGLAVAGLVILALAGCAKEPKVIGGIPRAKYNTKVVSLAPSATDLMGMAMQAERVIGVTDACPDVVAKGKPVVVHNTKIDYEKIAQLHPDIIIYDSSLYSDMDQAKLAQTGAELFDFKVTSLAQFEDTVYRLSSVAAIEVPIGEYMDRIYGMKARYAAPPEKAQLQVKTMVLMGTGTYYAAGTKTFAADMIKTVSGTPVGPDSDKFEVINPEAIVQENPNVIYSPGQGASILHDPRLQSVDAVKGHRVYDIKPDHILRINSQIDLVMEGLGTGISNYRLNAKK